MCTQFLRVAIKVSSTFFKVIFSFCKARSDWMCNLGNHVWVLFWLQICWQWKTIHDFINCCQQIIIGVFWSCLISPIVYIIFFIFCGKNLTVNSKSRNFQFRFPSISWTEWNKRPVTSWVFPLFSPQTDDCAIFMQHSPTVHPNWETQHFYDLSKTVSKNSRFKRCY